MNNYYFNKEKVNQILNKIKENLNKKNNILVKAFELDYKEWDIKFETEKFVELIEKIKEKEYLPKISKEEIVDGIGKIVLICNQNPYLIFNFIISSIYTNNSVEIILENKFSATNKSIIALIKKSLEELKYDSNVISYLEVDNQEEVIQIQNKYDMLYYFGNKEDYIKFTKRIHIDSKFENFGEIYVYIDSKDFKEDFINIDKFGYLNEIKVEYYNNDFEEALNSINTRNNVNKISVIFTKNIDKAYEFVKRVKSEIVYVNINPCEEFEYSTNLNNLVFNKTIKINK